MGQIRLYLLFLVFIGMGCNKPKIPHKIWTVDSIIKLDTGEEIKDCFRGEMIVIREDDNTITLPGFDKPLSSGKFRISKDTLVIEEISDCFFTNDKILFTLRSSRESDTLILRSRKLKLTCHNLGFKRGKMDLNVFDKYVDSSSWGTKSCARIRDELCNSK